MKPSYIHHRAEWPAFRWTQAVAEALPSVRHRQGRLLGRLDALEPGLRQDATRLILEADVLKTSAIEGEHLDPLQVRSSLARHLGFTSAGLPKPSRHVDGMVEMTLDASLHHDRPLTEARLHRWHTGLFPDGKALARTFVVGGWRTAASGPMQVVSGPIGRERVHFEAPESRRLPGEMRAFLRWFEQAPPADPVLHAAIAHLWFVTVHPYQDGNGRIGRAIADLALARGDRCRERFYGMSAQIEAERGDYYAELEAAQRGTMDVTRWVLWFLGCLDRSLDRAERALEGVVMRAKLAAVLAACSANERQLAVVDRLAGPFEGHLTAAKYAKLAKCSTDSALRDITALVERGVLVRNAAGGRSTSYRLCTAAELEAIRTAARGA